MAMKDWMKKLKKKAGEITTDATQKTAELAEKMKPVAERIDDVAGALGEKAKDAAK